MLRILSVMAICILFVAACKPNKTSDQPSSAVNKPQFEERPLTPEQKMNTFYKCSPSNGIVYFRDPRAPSLCFASMWQDARQYSHAAVGGPGLTWVPCSDDVTPLMCDHVPNPPD